MQLHLVRLQSRKRIRVAWRDCCTSRDVGGLNLINPEEAMHALLSKWIIKALEPGCSSLQLLLRYRILKIKPNEKGC